MPVSQTTSSTSGSTPPSTATPTFHFTPLNIFHLERVMFYNLSNTVTLPFMSANHSKMDKTELAYFSETYANIPQILSHPASATLAPVGIAIFYAMESTPPTQLVSKTISLQRLVFTHLHKNIQMKHISPPHITPSPSYSCRHFKSFHMALHRLTWIETLTKQAGKKRDL